MKLTESKIRSLIRITRKSGTTLYGYCPKCNKNEFGISLKEPHLFGCFRKKKCGWAGNVFTLLKFLGVKTDFKGKKEFEGLNIEGGVLEDFEDFKFEIFEKINMPIGFKRVKDHPYLRKRGYKQRDFETYLCGTSKLANKFSDYIIIGFQDFEKPIAYVSRALKGQEPKYRNSKNEVFSKYLDGLKEIDSNEAIIVEGHFDRIKTRNNLEELELKIKTVCCFGAKISDEQIKLLQREGVTKVNLFFDPDVLLIILKSGEKLLHKFEEVNIMTINDLDKDPGDIDSYELGEVYISKKNFINFKQQKLPDLEL